LSISTYESSVNAFLRQPENLVAAWDIADRLEEVKDELVKEFWRDYDRAFHGAVLIWAQSPL
jgi:hypothetical protein